MKKANILQAKARERFGFFSSLVIHFILFIVLSLSGVFMQRHNASDVTEVMFFSGGGGGGGGGGQKTDVEVEEAAAEEEAAFPTGDEISYAESQRELAAEKPKKVTPKPAAKPKEGAAAKVKGGTGTGTGGGHGSGHGTGTGSGTGPGSGSGSGGGHGSGHGTGIGSGVGPGISRNPAVPPRVVHSVSPVYPESQRQANIDGVSVLRLLIGTDGKVEEVTLMKSSGSSALDNSAIRACRQWRFTSAKNGSGQKVRCYWDIPIRFRLDR